MKLRVGIISANWGAFAHLPGWRAVPGVEVVGICTSRQETAVAAAKKYAIERAFWDAEAMAADPDIDIIDCGTRPNIRQSMVLAALRNGKHVYNGIPFAADFERAKELYQAWQASGNVAVVDAYCEWLPAVRAAKDLLDNDYLGQPFAGTCTFNMPLSNQPNPHFPYNWFWEKGLGVSAVRNLGSHALHLLVHLFGEVDELIAHDSQLLTEWRFPDGTAIQPQTNDFANMMLKFKSGLLLQFQVSWSATVGPGWSLEAYGSNGRIEMNAPSFPTAKDTQLRAGQLGGTGMQDIPIAEHYRHYPELSLASDFEPQASYTMAVSMHNMVQAIRGQARARPDFQQAWTIERIQEAIRISSQSRRWVQLKDIQ